MKWIAYILGAGCVLFFFPYTISVVCIVVAASIIPMAGVALGIMLDALYYAPGAASFPYATVTGIAATGIAIAARKIIRAHLATRG